MRDPLSALTDAFTSFLFGKVETTRLPVRTSTGQAQAVYLPTAAPGLGDSGVIIGREVYCGKGYIYDPFQLYGQQLPAPHWLVLGESGNGKSALEKTYVLRQLRFRDRQVVVLDAQGEDGVGEWNLIAQELGITPIRLDPMAALDGGIRLNPLDPSITTTGQLALLRTIIEVAMGHGLDERSGFALKVAHAYVNETIVDRQPVLTDIVEQLRHPEPESAEAMNVDIDDVRAWGLDVALVLDRLVDGDLRGMFDGPTTVGIDLDAPLIVFDLSHIDRNSIAMPILMAIVGVWLEHTWIRPDRKKRIFLVEEAWHIINSPFVAQLFQRLLKFGRRLGLSFVAVVHHLSRRGRRRGGEGGGGHPQDGVDPDDLRPEGRRGESDGPGARPAPLGGGDHPDPHPRHRGLGRQRQRPGGQTPGHRGGTPPGLHRPRDDRVAPPDLLCPRTYEPPSWRRSSGRPCIEQPAATGRVLRVDGGLTWRAPGTTGTERDGDRAERRHPGRPAGRPARLPARPDAAGLDGHRPGGPVRPRRLADGRHLHPHAAGHARPGRRARTTSRPPGRTPRRRSSPATACSGACSSAS